MSHELAIQKPLNLSLLRATDGMCSSSCITTLPSLFIAGNTFSGLITEPGNISEGPVNIKFTSNCIAVVCPIKEASLKTWLLHKITSFGQCGGIFTFEVCPHCSDSSGSVHRCSINLIQEKPTIILNILERAIRSNPNTSEIHYERSILGDIYHCGHDCTQPGRLVPAYSDPNIFSSGGSFSPPRTPRASVEVYTREQVESIDSGLPGTPQPEELSNGIPSPTSSYRSNPFRSPRHQVHFPPGEEELERHPVFRRRQSDETPMRRRSDNLPSSPPAESSPVKLMLPNHGRVQYALIDHSAPARMIRPEEYTIETQHTTETSPNLTATVPSGETATVYSTEQEPKERRNTYNKLKTLEESTEAVDDVIYDVPNCEFLSDPFMPSPPSPQYDVDTTAVTRSPNHHALTSPSPNHHALASPSPNHHALASPSPNHHALASPSPNHARTSPIGSPAILSPSHQKYTAGTDVQDREEDYAEAWISAFPRRKAGPGKREAQVTRLPKNHALAVRDTGSRKRFQSSSDILDGPMATSFANRTRDVIQNGGVYRPRTASVCLNSSDRHLEKASNDFLKRLNEEEEKLSKVLAASRKERNEEIMEEARDRLGDLNKAYMFTLDDLDHEYSDPDTILETCSNLVDYQTRSHPSYLPGSALPVHKEPTNNIKGYAYKVTIPFTNTQYDVPRRAAAAPDLTTMSQDAPPKPKRHVSTEHLYFMNS